MKTIHETIAELRKMAGLTQEELGKQVGVSMQAVSKWENGSLPDTALLPGIADALGTSIDELFGRSAAYNDAGGAAAYTVWQSDAPLTTAFELIWAMQRAVCAKSPVLRSEDASDAWKGQMSQIMTPQGVSLVNPGKRYAFLYPRPALGWEHEVLQLGEQAKFFAFIGQPEALKVLVFLHSVRLIPYTLTCISQKTGVEEETLKALLRQIEQYGLVHADQLTLDDGQIPIYTARPNPALIPLLTFSLEMIHRPNSFCYYNCDYTEPFLGKME